MYNGSGWCVLSNIKFSVQATAKWLPYSCSAQNSHLRNAREKIWSMLHGLAHKYQPEVIHYQQLAEWSSGLRIGLITARVGFESQ